ncbi:hypothetical protein ABBQ38_013613 [Trebouxia sp. C0009 RCD-2024]
MTTRESPQKPAACRQLHLYYLLPPATIALLYLKRPWPASAKWPETGAGSAWKTRQGHQATGPLRQPTFTDQQPAYQERQSQGDVTQHALNAWRGMTATAGGAQDNKQQDDMVNNPPQHSPNPSRMRRLGSRRVQGKNSQQVSGRASRVP